MTDEHESYIIGTLVVATEDTMALALSPCPDRADLFDMANELLDRGQSFVVLIDRGVTPDQSRELLEQIMRMNTAHTN